MSADEVIELGTKLGLNFNRSDNFKDALDNDRVVFNGVNGQRFLFDTAEMCDDEILEKLGESLILMGKRMKSMEIHNVISVNSDHDITFD
jgi:hypothetical protein